VTLHVYVSVKAFHFQQTGPCSDRARNAVFQCSFKVMPASAIYSPIDPMTSKYQ